MRYWILQSNAARLDLDRYLREVNPVVHGVRRYVDQIVPGDRTFLWRAAGGLKVTPGIVALATVLEPPVWMSHDRPDLLSVPKPKFRVRLHVDELRLDEGMITRQDVKKMPEMMTHPIVTSNTGSDFALSDEQTAALLDLWRVLTL